MTSKKKENKDKGIEKQEEMQKKYMELQMLSQQIKQIQTQVQNIDNQISELETTSQSLQELSKTKPGTEMFVPLSAGVFAKAELKDIKDILVNVGAGTAVKKPLPDVKKMVDDQAVEIGKYKQQAMEQLERLIEHAKKLEDELKNLV